MTAIPNTNTEDAVERASAILPHALSNETALQYERRALRQLALHFALLPPTVDAQEWATSREAAARIVDPDAWHETLPTDGCGPYWIGRRNKARTKAHAILALSPSPDRSVLVEALRYRHKARGTEYDLVGTAELQDATGNGVPEGALLAIYRGDDGKLWARRHSEFGDGRFERISALAALEGSPSHD